MPSISSKIKPASGFSHLLHIALTALLPVLMFILVRLGGGFVGLAAALILLSKWRMFAVKPRHWPANVRANAVDLTVGLSILIFMTHSSSQLMQLVWATLYGVWLVVVKPRSDTLSVAWQALIGLFLGLTAIFLNWGGSSTFALVLLAWLVCYSSARHFFAAFDEPLSRYLANSWAFFGAALTWVLSHWLLFYGPIAQPTLLLSVIGFSLACIYYLDHEDKLSLLLRRQLVFVMLAIIMIVLVFSNWGDKAV